MQLGAPLLLVLLALLPAAALAWWWLWRARRLHQTALGAQIDGQRRGQPLSRALLLLALALLAAAAARPLWSAGEQTLSRSDFSLIVALDVSLSMAAEDVGDAAAPVSRFDAAKSEIRRLIDGRRGDRVGLVIFAGNAFLRFPLTRDHQAALEVLEALQPGEALVPPGSDIAAAIALASATIARAASDDNAAQLHGAIAVVSDGETHTGDAPAAAADARALGLQVFAVGVGAESGAQIPLAPGVVKTDPANGAPILTRLNLDQLRRLADAGGGRLLTLDAPGAIASLNADLAALDLARPLTVAETALAEQFQWFALAAALALLAAAAARVFAWRLPLSLSRRPRLAALAALAGALLFTGGCASLGIEQANREGVQHYAAGEYAEALDAWREAQRLADRANTAVDPRLHLNAGRALHQLGEYERAETESLAALRADDPARRAIAWFHIGNHRWANADLLGARAAFIEALRETPSLRDAKINLELINAILDSLEEPPPEDPGQEPGGEPSGSGQAGQAGQTGQAGSAEPSPDPQSSPNGQPQTAADSSPQPSESTALPGQDGALPTAPSFTEDTSLRERREQALDNLQDALSELPLENASLEQALAVLDALRAVPGERLAAGRLTPRNQPFDW